MTYSTDEKRQQRISRYAHSKKAKGAKKSAPDKSLAPQITPETPKSQLPKTFLGIPTGTVTYKIPSQEDQKSLRKEFEKDVRKAFIKHIAKTQKDKLLADGITEKEIKLMLKDGNTPDGYNTHHILPIHGGGDNKFSNLILIKRVPYHDMIHYNLMSPQTKGMKEGEARQIVIPLPQGGTFFAPAEKYKILEHHAENGRRTYGKGERLDFNYEKRKPVGKPVKGEKAIKKAYGIALKQKTKGR